jgi:hypothetical protein
MNVWRGFQYDGDVKAFVESIMAPKQLILRFSNMLPDGKQEI